MSCHESTWKINPVSLNFCLFWFFLYLNRFSHLDLLNSCEASPDLCSLVEPGGRPRIIIHHLITWTHIVNVRCFNFPARIAVSTKYYKTLSKTLIHFLPQQQQPPPQPTLTLSLLPFPSVSKIEQNSISELPICKISLFCFANSLPCQIHSTPISWK